MSSRWSGSATAVAALDKMIALCHNPVSASDDPMCGGAGLVTRPGDIRYHRARILVGQGLAGQRVHVVDSYSHVEVYYGPHRVRHIAAALLGPHQRV